ncbi:stringent starvation protein B [Aggregicoccus sp. 17bor-14]|uniref:ClpXP protease specificity-enhancing factor SspB n=1 Tax=Myxococcaceae TaxID=31 RepID=UPI00129C8228|nr:MULTISPECIES: ClpXP protease specificity-enhancing factor SspB [Myxococcaceae]MBF5044466.1 stringent starvation protein B [Simulacricoccus sp. 17bor-14]MRI90212.1 stringent starvation protein B [Aggregicoccus sp. 17bor-14]
MESKVPEKKERLLAALDQGMVMIHLDARRPGVAVPSHLGGEAHLRLNLSYRFDPPDLTVNEWGVRSTLSFSGSRFTVAVPWNALFAITSHVSREFWLYPEDMPQELLQHPLATPPTPREAPTVPAPVPGGARPRAVLREVSCDRAEDPAPGVPAPVSAPLRPEPAPQPLAVTPPPPATAESEGPPKEPPPPGGPRRSHLRVVK